MVPTQQKHYYTRYELEQRTTVTVITNMFPSLVFIIHLDGVQQVIFGHMFYNTIKMQFSSLFLLVQPAVVAGPHARCNWVFSRHDCSPHVP